MGWFSRQAKHEAEGSKAIPPKECAHPALAPHWDRPQDMGNDELAIAFICGSCHRQFTPAEAQGIIAKRG